MKAIEKYILLFVFIKKMFCTGDESMEMFVHAGISKLTDTLILWNESFMGEICDAYSEINENARICICQIKVKYDSEKVKSISDKLSFLEQEYENNRVNNLKILNSCQRFMEKNNLDKKLITEYVNELKKMKNGADCLAAVRWHLEEYKRTYGSLDESRSCY